MSNDTYNLFSVLQDTDDSADLDTETRSSEILIEDSDDDDWSFSNDNDSDNADTDYAKKSFNIDGDGYTQISNLTSRGKKYELKSIKFVTPYKKDKYKELLCKNILAEGSCKYGDKCKFAHDIKEQIMEDIYKRAYDIVQNKIDLTKVKIRQEPELYKILQKLCTVCHDCERHKCPGGYNCRNGACDKKYVICKQDLQYGRCDTDCDKIHLTKMGFEPYYQNIIGRKKPKIKEYTNQGILLNKKFFENINNYSSSDSGSNRNDNTLKMFITEPYNVGAQHGFSGITFSDSIFEISVS